MPDKNIQVGGFTTGELKVASFWVRNGIVLKRVGYSVLIGLCILVWGYAFAGFIDAYAISYPRESRITRNIALNQQLLASLQSDAPQDVSTGNVSVFQTTDNRFDMAVEISNPNPQWWVEFNYHFDLSGEETPTQNGYVLPQGTQILTQLGYAPKTRGGRTATLVVENVRWHRVDPAVVGASYPDFAAQRLALSFDTITYDTNIALGDKHVGQTSFTVNNHSAYGFWDLELVVRLYRGSTVIAINKITLPNVLPNEKRPMQMIWLDNIPGVSKTEIIPQVNLLDPGAYLPSQYFTK